MKPEKEIDPVTLATNDSIQPSRESSRKDTTLRIPLSQDVLNIANKTRNNPLAWRGQFSPQLVEALLRTYAPSNAIVLDPFVGSGTVLYECARLGMVGLGVEINPAAATLARVYQLTNLPRHNRQELLAHLHQILSPLLDEEMPLFTSPGLSAKDAKANLIKVTNQVTEQNERLLLEALICISDYDRNSNLPLGIQRAWNRLSDLVLSLPYSKNPIKVALCDARALPLPENSIDFVVTSPPYINVFNYHQQYRQSMEALGWDLLEVAPSEIGANRKHRGNRLLTVIQYCIDMAAALFELQRVMKPSCRVVMIVGRESNVRKTPFYNGKILERVATETAGFTLAFKQERVFKNKFGQHIYEDVLHLLSLDTPHMETEPNVRQIALEILQDARYRIPKEVGNDLSDAIQQVDLVKRSPLFQPRAANGKSNIPSVFSQFSRSGV